jgi:hypothetical protein
MDESLEHSKVSLDYRPLVAAPVARPPQPQLLPVA